jgi:DNA-3-methyladenine glycosylase I
MTVKSPSQKQAAKTRCRWASNEWNIPYHDAEWGVPVHDDRVLFEFLILEGAQAGLSWDTILRKREHYRKVFDNFDVKRIARYDAKKVRALLNDAGIVRNRLKIAATIDNAKAFLAVQKEFGSFDKYIWQVVGGKPKKNQRAAGHSVPAKTAESDAMSKDLKKRGFRFVGSTICYAFMQAVGMVNDHSAECFRHHQVSARRKSRKRIANEPRTGKSLGSAAAALRSNANAFIRHSERSEESLLLSVSRA